MRSLALWFGTFSLAAAFNNPPGVDIWCGKAYRASNASFEPGGWLVQPAPSLEPLLDLRVRPRMNLYTDDELWGSFIVDAALSHINGYHYDHDTDIGNGHDRAHEGSNVLYVDISLANGRADLVSSAVIPVNTTSNEVSFSLSRLEPQFDPYEIVLRAVSSDGNRSYTARTQLYRLPSRTDGGSITKLDRLYGGLLVKNEHTDWEPILPYSFYVSWGGWLEKSLDNVQYFKDQGYNIVHIIPNGGQPFNFTELNIFLDKCDEIGLWIMYDMRWTYQNATSVEEQVNMLKSRKSMLLWYTGDEPDGNSDPVNAPKIAYDQIKSLDPWHPVSLCLNCYNFYYKEYSSGADIILSDVYPIAVNTSYSEVYGTVCNATYGCCGCDDCKGDMEDISDRLDVFAQYQEWIGGPPKTFWGVPQAFGNESFWKRYPTSEEEVTMNMLSINHNAKGIVMWTYPTSSGLSAVTSKLSRALLRKDVTSYLLGSHTTALEATGQGRIDAAGWRVGKQMLVSILYLEYKDLQSEITVTLPSKAASVSEVLWGPGGWSVSGGKLVKDGVTGLESSLLVVTLL
ncbi:conserved hypothetical protein [Paecilomyces variotii No. 5]|uniref:Glycoside hydrolase superfamily n=1 Tax=Byssochlamys spectabilis (strain No. 5 / NBRC 109023) TaxID=1356009 RepID=V5FG92_BYSSN|nr:conserved hypothetical protein [Paecilomyces variotii No. 5]